MNTNQLLLAPNLVLYKIYDLLAKSCPLDERDGQEFAACGCMSAANPVPKIHSTRLYSAMDKVIETGKESLTYHLAAFCNDAFFIRYLQGEDNVLPMSLAALADKLWIQPTHDFAAALELCKEVDVHLFRLKYERYKIGGFLEQHHASRDKKIIVHTGLDLIFTPEMGFQSAAVMEQHTPFTKVAA